MWLSQVCVCLQDVVVAIYYVILFWRFFKKNLFSGFSTKNATVCRVRFKLIGPRETQSLREPGKPSNPAGVRVFRFLG